MTTFLRTGSFALTAALCGLAAAGILIPAPAQQPVPADLPADAGQVTPLPATNVAAGPALMERSPFSPARGPFSRSAGPPAPEIEVRLAGIYKLGKEMRASLLVGGQTLSVRKGDETPVGVIADIEASAVVIEGATPRRLELFKQ